MLDFFEQLFITFFNMSITGSYIILAIILLRLLLQKAPKIFSYCLWIVAGLRLICPFSFSSVFSIFNFFSVPAQVSSRKNTTVNDYIPSNIGTMKIPEISTGINAADEIINPVLPAPQIGDSANPMQIIMVLAAVLWITGIAAMAIYGIISLIKIHKTVKFATKLDGNIFECEKVRSPFVFGFVNPKIYLPCGMNEKQREYVVLHERNHIRRFDHITKLLAFAVLTLHWYNPLVWVGYNLMVRDMEMSCDEKVMQKFSEEEKKSYGLTLVAVGSSRRFAAVTPLSFGENVIEKRIVNILNFKKPKSTVIITCVIVCLTAAAVCLTNSVKKTHNKDDLQAKIEAFIEDDWQKQIDGNDYYKYELAVAGVNVVEISDDNKTAYGWQRIYYFNTYYPELLNYEQILDDAVSMPAFGFRAEMDEEGNILSVTNYKDDKAIPESIRQKGHFDSEIFTHAKNKAKDKYKELYDLVKTYSIEYSYTCQDDFDSVKITGCELISDHFGKPYLVIKAKNTDKNGACYISGHYELMNGADGKPYEAKQPSPDGETVVPSGESLGKEVLHFTDLSVYIDGIEKKSYILRIYVSDNNGEFKELMLELKVGNATSKKPKLNYQNLDTGKTKPITQKIKKAVSGAIYPGSNYHNEIILSEEKLKEVVNCINKTKFTPTQKNSLSYGETIYVSISDSEGEKRAFTVAHGGIVEDFSGDFYKANNSELFILLRNIANEQGITAQPDRPSAVGGSIGYTELTTAPQIIIPHVSTTAAPSPSPEFINEPRTRYIVSNIEFLTTSEDLQLELLGADAPNKNYLETTFINHSNDIFYIALNQETKKLVNGEWQQFEGKVDYEPLRDLVMLYPNYMCSVPFGFNFDETENGRYQIITTAYKGTEEGANKETSYTVKFEFDLSVQTVTYAEAGEKIKNPDAVYISPSTSGVYYVKSRLSNDEIKKITDLYNNFSWSAGNEPDKKGALMHSYFTLSVIDGNKEFFVFVFEDGTVSLNGRYYNVGNSGKEMYKLLSEW